MRNVVTSIFVDKVRKSGFLEIETPIIEPLELFKRSSEQSEIVKKEMFEFSDKANRNLVLRPEALLHLLELMLKISDLASLNQKFYYYTLCFAMNNHKRDVIVSFIRQVLRLLEKKLS
ncbi:ATP phosphoribosyltransferase regulatory subunit [Mycoplasmopsis cynos]|uniref:ATP phosphoribosyltransferase regulatory subunit n=1 Tax=Mycoplasmopsis cynos TaxID=171284 RepID=UPI0024CA0796|nr:ATP phosphoribosyltransferase regulatory subunit [Mycoplasmopsis cynos]WAM04741.1 ATP phosphoribosyltransferase regulatory subunit [Mycoplasmopsis cynos]